MRLGYDLTIEQTQKLSMTPELIQAIQILQFNNLELSDYVQNEIMENPVLDVDSSVAATIEEVDIREAIVSHRDDMESYRQWENSEGEEEGDFTYEQFVQVKYTLVDYLLMQLHFSRLQGINREIGRYIVEAIDENGYLTMSIDEIKAAFQCSGEQVEEVLDVIQTFDPCGVGARNLRECLIIQLAAQGQLTDEIEYIVENMLEDLAENRIAQIGKALNISAKEVQHIADLIKTLDPKPGMQYDSEESTKYIVPDIYVEKIDGEYVVTSNESSSPKLMISSYYYKLVEEAKSDDELNSYLSDRFNAAVWLIRSIEQRKQTIYNVAKAIVDYQRDFFDKGEKALKPLTLKEIAGTVGIHESTVSRSINGKYLQSARGVYELKYFFTSGVSSSDGEGVSSNSVKSLIREMVDGEDPKKPLSDQVMSERLKDMGIDISRRTVAKYREDMDIQSSSKRRRF